MVAWVNRAVFQAPRNGTTSHTIDPASTVGLVAGAAFTPTAGRLLVVVVEGAVTSSTPSGWTLPSGGSVVSYSGLYVWYRTAAGGDTFATTHNGANYPVSFAVYEFPAGSTFVKSASGTGVSNTGANPNLTGLSGTNLIFGVKGTARGSGETYGGAVWSSGYVEDYDGSVPFSSTDGYWVTIAAQEGVTTSSAQPTATISGTSFTAEALTFAVKVPAGGSSYPATGVFAAVSVTVGSIAARLAAVAVAASVATSAGAVTAARVVSGATVATSATAGAVTAFHPTAGLVSAVSDTSGVLSQDGSLTGVVTAVSTTSGAVTTRRPTSGASSASSTVTGSVTRTSTATGTVSAVSATTGGLTPTGTSGTVTATSTTAGTVTARRTTTGAVTATTDTGGDATRSTHASGVVVCVSTVSLTETPDRPFPTVTTLTITTPTRTVTIAPPGHVLTVTTPTRTLEWSTL